MNTDRELMQQALEALEAIAWSNNTTWQSQRAKIEVNAIRKALAQPEQEPVAWMHVMDNTEGLKANGTGIVSITQKRKHPFGKPGVDFSRSYPVTSTPLYTTPPHRKPLTDEEIQDVVTRAVRERKLSWLGFEKDDQGTYNIPVLSPADYQFARAIEAAHGIKE